MSAPLDGIVVVTVEQAIAAPLATRHLADLGARVLKIEHPDGGDFARHYDANTAGQSTYFVWANRGKDSLVLDLKAEDGRARLGALIAGADVFVQNLSPGGAARAGLLAHQLVERHPALIACDISGYGLGGPRSDDKAYDLAIQSEAGAVMLTGSPDQPSKVGISIADISSAMYALSSILAALYRRDRTGEGAAISLSMLECLAEWTSPQVLTAAATGVAPGRSPRRHPMIAPYGMFGLSDGRTVLIAVQADREWRAMAGGVLERPELGDDDRFATNTQRIAHVDELETIVRDVFETLSADDVIARLHAARITVADVRTPLDVWGHEQLAARGRKVRVTTETGDAAVFKAPFNTAASTIEADTSRPSASTIPSCSPISIRLPTEPSSPRDRPSDVGGAIWRRPGKTSSSSSRLCEVLVKSGARGVDGQTVIPLPVPACVRRRTAPQRPDDVDAGRRDVGMTLVEVIVTVILLGVVVVPALVGLASLTKTSSISRGAANAETALINVADRINRAPSDLCDYHVFARASMLTQGWAETAVSTTHSYLDRTTGTWLSGPAGAAACPATGYEPRLIQKVRVTVTSPDSEITRTIEVVKSDV